jgi:hypothetical protein
MFKFFLIIVFAVAFVATNAQEIKYYTVNPGENILDKVPKEEICAYEDFQQGIVVFKNGDKSGALLNYHYFFEEMLFVSQEGDTLALLNPNEVESIYIKSNQYFYTDNRFVKLDTTVGDIKIAVAGFFTTVNMKKVGAFGTATDGAMNQYVAFTSPNGRRVDLTPNTVTTYSFRRILFIADKFNKFVPVTKKSIYSLYPEKANSLKAYLQSHEVDFFSRKAVIDLIVYMNNL